MEASPKHCVSSLLRGVHCFFRQVLKHILMLISVTVKPNNKLVWNESVGITLDMIENVWKDSAEMVVEHATEMTLSVCNTPCSVF